MRKNLILLLIISLFALPICAEEVDWSKYDNIDNAWDGQKVITNKQFEETMNALEAKKNKKMNRQKEKAIRKLKGNSLHDNMDAHKKNIESQTPLEEAEECQVLNIPVNFVSNGKIIDCGFYRVIGEKKDDGVYLELYQSHNLITKLKARETNDDFNQEFIQFAKLIPDTDTRMKLIFGSVDFNAYTYINILNPQYNN